MPCAADIAGPMEIGFGEALLIIGLLLASTAALSGLTRGTVLSISVLSVAFGIALSLADVVEIDVGDTGVIELIELALILTLISDGLIVDRELLGRHWGPPTRALVFAMPITLGLLAVGAKLLFPDLSWAEAFLLGAVLSPTDPVVTSTVVTARRVPAAIRHTLNLESGLNDGLALRSCSSSSSSRPPAATPAPRAPSCSARPPSGPSSASSRA